MEIQRQYCEGIQDKDICVGSQLNNNNNNNHDKNKRVSRQDQLN